MRALLLAAVVLTAMAGASLGTACAGFGARADSLPSILSTYENVVAPIAIVAIGAEQDAGHVSAERAEELRGYVIQLGDVLAGRGAINSAPVVWALLTDQVSRGIDTRVASGAIGPGVGASIKEVLRMFAARLVQVGGGQRVGGLELTGYQAHAVKAVLR